MFAYPRDFVERVVNEYENWPEIADLARENKYILGRFLAEGSIMRLSPEEIVLALESGDCVAVRLEAEAAVRRRRLHADWIRIMVSEIKSAKDKTVSRWSRLPTSRRKMSSRPPSIVPQEITAGE